MYDEVLKLLPPAESEKGLRATVLNLTKLAKNKLLPNH